MPLTEKALKPPQNPPTLPFPKGLIGTDAFNQSPTDGHT